MDDTLMHANIFFFITTIAVILITLLLILALAYVVKIVRAFSSIAETLKRESEHVADDIAELRERVREEGEKVSGFWKFATGFFLNKVVQKFAPKSRGESKNESKGESRHSGRSRKASRAERDSGEAEE
jgi:hypothetical protein